MSLLLQALQKAAKSREEGEVDLSADALAMADELALESPIPPARAIPEPTSTPPAGSAKAAAVVQAGSIPAFSPMDYAREHYMLTFIGGAFLVALAYGAYVYIQINRPFHSSAPPASPVAVAPHPPTPPAANQATPASAKISGLPGTTAASAVPENAAAAASAPAPAVVPATATAMKSTAENTEAMPARSAIEEPMRKPRNARDSTAPRVVRAQAEKRNRAGDAPPLVDASDSIETVVVPSSHAKATSESKPAKDIAVRRDVNGELPVSPTLTQAYEALQGGDRAKAKGLYEQVLRADPKNMDALLGMASIALNDGRVEDAGRYYQQALELDPRNPYAQAGLISIVGGADLQASESRLKQLIARDPSAYLYFSLGNLYAEQAQWPAAQQAYYQAFQMQPDNPDYAFNLAIGLEHLGQRRIALDYYRKALDLSFKKGHANFDQSLVIQRVGQLSTRVEQ
ncbi:MAG TPA: tetratricopeptide repeat protein [Burkholderiales bacterium]|nr:tetratricopeptide repeat protein [Burkholderiales bacterium]